MYMGISIIAAGILTLLLITSWIYFLRVLAKRKQMESFAMKRAEDMRRQFQGEFYALDNFIANIAKIHQLALENVAHERDPDVSKLMLDSACQMLKCPAGSLLLADKRTGDLSLAALKGISESQHGASAKSGEGVIGRVYDTGKWLTIDDLDTDPRFINAAKGDIPFKSFVSVPLKVRSKVIGVMNVGSLNAHQSFDDRAVQLLIVFADQTAMMLENFQRYRDLEGFYIEVVEALSRALEFKENVAPAPDAHRKIREYAKRTAEELSLPDSIVRHIEFASIIYGVGKIGIDDAILRKPGKLSDAEFEQVKKHPEIGHKLVSKINFLLPITPMILYHQERWDGKGYPAGLKGEEIPLGSRIIAVVNAYHAMTSDRPYRKALMKDQAVDELRKCAGTQFDSKVVDAFIRALQKSPNGGSGFEPTPLGR